MAKREIKQQVQKLLYRREEAAFALGISVTSIDALVSKQMLRTRRAGRCVVIPAADVVALAETIVNSDVLAGVVLR